MSKQLVRCHTAYLALLFPRQEVKSATITWSRRGIAPGGGTLSTGHMYRLHARLDGLVRCPLSSGGRTEREDTFPRQGRNRCSVGLRTVSIITW